MTGYTIRKAFLPGLPKEPYRHGLGAYEGVVNHETATPEATCAAELKYFIANWKTRKAFAHYFVDWIEIVQMADDTYKAWGAGNGNPRYVHVELCNTKDPEKFKESYKRYVWLVAELLRRKNLGVTDGKTCVSHDWVSKNLGGTNHADPIAYLKSHGISWAQHVANVKAMYDSFFVKPVVIKWVKKDEKWFCYEGDKVKSGWVKYKDNWYYTDEHGMMLTGWVKYKDNWYYMNPEKDKGEMMTGWLNIKGKKYYCNPAKDKGEMFVGHHVIDGVVHHFEEDGSLCC